MCHGRWCYSNLGTKTLPIAEVRAFICATLLASKHFESVYGVLLGIRIFWKPRHFGAYFWTKKPNGNQFYNFDTPGFRSFLRWPSSTDHPTITPRSRQPPISPYPPSNIPPRVDPAALPPWPGGWHLRSCGQPRAPLGITNHRDVISLSTLKRICYLAAYRLFVSFGMQASH